LFCASDQILSILKTTVELDVVFGSLVAVVRGLVMYVDSRVDGLSNFAASPNATVAFVSKLNFKFV